MKLFSRAAALCQTSLGSERNVHRLYQMDRKGIFRKGHGGTSVRTRSLQELDTLPATIKVTPQRVGMLVLFHGFRHAGTH